jgi:hypothetical protein
MHREYIHEGKSGGFMEIFRVEVVVQFLCNLAQQYIYNNTMTYTS